MNKKTAIKEKIKVRSAKNQTLGFVVIVVL
jgi:hypothetical protein